MRRRVHTFWAMLAVFSVVSSALSPAIAAADATPTADAALVPTLACDDTWFDWQAERNTANATEITAIKKTYGDGEGNRVGAVMRQYAADLRTSDPPPALLGVAIIGAMQAEAVAESWEAVAIGEPSPYDQAKDERFYQYSSRIFDAFTRICDTGYEFGDWTFSDGELAPTPTPFPFKTAPVLREDVCSDLWFTRFLDRVEVNFVVFGVAFDDRTQLQSFFDSAAYHERESNPPPGWTALSILFRSFYEGMSATLAQPGTELPQLAASAELALIFDDAKRLTAAYNAICGTDYETGIPVVS